MSNSKVANKDMHRINLQIVLFNDNYLSTFGGGGRLMYFQFQISEESLKRCFEKLSVGGGG